MLGTPYAVYVLNKYHWSMWAMFFNDLKNNSANEDVFAGPISLEIEVNDFLLPTLRRSLSPERPMVDFFPISKRISTIENNLMYPI